MAKQEKDRQICTMQHSDKCKNREGSWLLNDFFTAINDKFFANGKIHICKDCIKEYCYNKDGNVDMNKFKQILMMINAPFFSQEFDTACNKDKDTIGVYMRAIYLNHKGKEWKDGEKFEKAKINIEDIDNQLNTDIDLTYLREKWGEGYDDDNLYIDFEKKYKFLKNNYPEKTSMHTEALFKYIRYSVMEERAISSGDAKDAKSWGELANKAATAAKINPSQLSKADLSDGLSTFSELSQAVEKEVDIIRILPRFKYRPNDALDFNIWCYINYMQDLSGLPQCDYEDVYNFYDKKIQDYVEQYGDPYEIFKDDPTIKNRESIKRFIKEDGDE